jgi:hypothetical protein
MKIVEAINHLASTHLDCTNDWYGWREIDETNLPSGIVLPPGNQYRKNEALKIELSKKMTNTDCQATRSALINYYISTWGGISGNLDETMEVYGLASPDNLISRGSRGIASWSKALCIHNPNKYAIFDARVSASLNALQIIYNTDNKVLFPVLASRNHVIKEGVVLIRNEALAAGWIGAADQDFYRDYLGYLEEVVAATDKSIPCSIYTVEMLLFSMAEVLINQAFHCKKSK